VRLNGKSLRFAIIPALALLAAGCGGIHASKTVSPLDFFLPGLIKADPPPANSDPRQPAPATAEPVIKQVAQI
jgi:hypothetical protein